MGYEKNKKAEIMDYKHEFNRLLAVAKQAVDNVDFKNRQTMFAPLRVLKNAVDCYMGKVDIDSRACNCERCTGIAVESLYEDD